MSYTFGMMIESLVAVLLAITIGYCYLLNNRLKRVKADEQSLKATISELITATEMAERAVAGLRTTAHECELTLGQRLSASERCCTELARQVKAGDAIISRISRAVTAAHPLEQTPAAPNAPDPNAVAAAARSFADRMRERMSVRAA